MGLKFEKFFKPDPNKEKEINDSLGPLEDKIKQLEFNLGVFRAKCMSHFNISAKTLELFNELKKNNSTPAITGKEIEYYNKAALSIGLITDLSLEERNELPKIVEENNIDGQTQLKFLDYSSLILTKDIKKDLNILNYIDYVINWQAHEISETKRLKNYLSDTLISSIKASVENAKLSYKTYSENFETAASAASNDPFLNVFNNMVDNYHNAVNDYWSYIKFANNQITYLNKEIALSANVIKTDELSEETLNNIDKYLKDYEKIDSFIQICKKSVSEYKQEAEKPKEKNIVNKENQNQDENIEFQKGLLDFQYNAAIEKHDMNFNEQDLKDMSDSILLSGFLLDYSHRDYQRIASDYFMALEKERKQKTTYADEIEYFASREDTSKYYNQYLNVVDTNLKSNDPNFVRKVIGDAQKITDAAASLQYSIFDTLKFNDDSTTKTLASYIGLTQSVNKYVDLLVEPERIPDDVREDYTRARDQIMGFKQGLSQIMEKCYVGDKTTYNQILEQISNKQTYNSLVDTSKINRAFNKLTKLNSEDKTRIRLESGRNILQEQKQKLIEVHDHVLEFAKSEKNGDFDGIFPYFSGLKREAERINKENNHIGLVGKVADQKAKDLVEDQLDSFTALSSDYSKKWLIGKLFNLGTYFKLNDMQKELANHYDNNFLKIVREGPGISQKTLTELVNGIEPTKENYKALMLYGTRTAFSNANFSQSIVDFNNRYASLEIDRLNRADVEKQLVILDQLNNKNSIQNVDVKESQKAIVNEDIIEKDVHQNK